MIVVNGGQVINIGHIPLHDLMSGFSHHLFRRYGVVKINRRC